MSHRGQPTSATEVGRRMHQQILLVLTGRPHRAWSLTGCESEQNAFSHSLFATEIVPVERKERFFSAEHAYW